MPRCGLLCGNPEPPKTPRGHGGRRSRTRRLRRRPRRRRGRQRVAGVDRDYQLQRAGRHAGRPDAAAVRRAPGLRRTRAGAARRRRRRQPGERRRPDEPAADRHDQRPLRPREGRCSIAAPTRTWQPRTASTPLYAALNLRVGAEGALSAAARVPAIRRSTLPRSDEGAARQGRRSERAPDQEGLVLGLQLRSVGRRRNRRARRSGAPPTPATSRR